MDIDEQERQLRGQLIDLHRSYERMAKPIVDALVRLECLKVKPPLVRWAEQGMPPPTLPLQAMLELVVDANIPLDEVRFVQDRKIVERIVGLGDRL